MLRCPPSWTLRPLIVGAIAMVTASRPLTAQSTAATVDSITRLNVDGRWQAAYSRALSTNGLAPAALCATYAEMVYALDRLGRYDEAMGRVRDFNTDCNSIDIGGERQSRFEMARKEVTLPPLPREGFDASGIPIFWNVVDTLLRDAEPSDSLWHALFATPGYRLSWVNVQPLREDLEFAYRPSHRSARDSIVAITDANDDRSNRLRHLVRVLGERTALATYLDSLRQHLPLETAVTVAQRFLPPGTTANHPPPLVTTAIFRDDSYSAGERGIVVDLANSRHNDLTLLLAHEFHHSFIGLVTEMNRPERNASDAQLINALFSLRNEGAADQIDKPYPLVPRSETFAPYAKRYNAEYAKTRTTLHTVDSLLSAVSPADTSAIRAAGRKIQTLFWSAGHPNGAYMMRTIVETFGMDSLFAADRNPFGFLRIYETAEIRRGNGRTFSPGTLALLDAEEKKLKKN